MTAFAEEWAEKKNASPAQLALAWLLAQKPFIIPIPGTTNPHHLVENMGGLAIEFTTSELAEIRNSLEAIPSIGFRKQESVFTDL